MQFPLCCLVTDLKCDRDAAARLAFIRRSCSSTGEATADVPSPAGLPLRLKGISGRSAKSLAAEDPATACFQILATSQFAFLR